jgi:formylglycine-generating enzyme required for sulfatase activity
MSKTEVSQKQWIQVMKSKNPSYYQKGDTYPVEYITWQEAKAFAARVNKRLCSPQEWQKAFSYLKKDVVFDNAILGRKTNAGPEPVDYGEKSELGVLNLIGNVRELLDNNGQAAVIGFILGRS